MAHLKRKKNTSGSEKNKLLTNLLFYGYCVLVFFVLPVIYFNNMIDGIQPVRLMVLSIGLAVIGIMILVFNKKTFPAYLWKNPIIYSSGGLAAITVISMFFADNRQESFFDIAKTTLFFAFLLMSVLILYLEKQWPEKVSMFVTVSAFVSLGVGFYQYVNDVFLLDVHFLADGRSVIYNVKGLMAHKNQYAINLMLMLPFLIYGAVALRKIWRLAAITAGLLTISMLILIHTRSVLLAIALSGFVMLTFIAINHRLLNISRRTITRALIATLTVAILMVIFIASIPAKHEFTRLGQIKSMLKPDAGNNFFRLKIWKLTTEMIADQPLTGVGAGNWKLQVAGYFTGYDFEGHELNWLRPHNDLLWMFAEKGLPGLIIYLAMFFFTLFYLIRAFYRKTEFNNRVLALLMLGGFLAYHISSMFSFPYERINQQIFLYFFASAAILLNFTSGAEKSIYLNHKLIAATFVLVIFPAIYSSAVIKSDRALIKARVALQKSDWRQLLLEMETVENWSRNMDSEAMPFAWYRGLAYSGSGNTQAAVQAYQEALVVHPTKVTVLHNLAIMYARLGDNDQAYNYLDRVLKISPTYKMTLSAKASLLMQEGRIVEAFDALNSIPQKRRDQTVKENLNAVRQILLRQLVDDVVARQINGENFDALAIMTGAKEIFQDPSEFALVFNNLFNNELDNKSRLEVLKLIPPVNLSDEAKEIINQLEQH